MDHGMSPDFEADKDEGDDGKNYLQPLRALLSGAECTGVATARKDVSGGARSRRGRPD